VNNLDADVAGRRADVVVYGGTGKTARDWPCFPMAQKVTKRRYSPAECTGAIQVVISGNPDEAKICTSQITNAFSKKLENHRAAVALRFAWTTSARFTGS
jgi:hypothetical protein